MKDHYLLYFVLFISFTSCVKEEPNTNTDYNILNNYEKNLIVELFVSGNMVDTFSIASGENYIIYELADGKSFPRFQLGIMDSAIIYFSDTITVTHYYKNAPQQVVSRTILDLSNWSGGKTEEYKYEYYYNFTNADYQEALSLQ